MYLFVYGSLRKGLHNNYLLDKANYIGTFSTVDKYIMIGTKSFSYPYLVHPTYLKSKLYDSVGYIYSKNIVGEVYEINQSTLKHIDKIEGYPEYYTRKTIEVKNNIAKINAYAYILENGNIINSIERYIDNRFMFVESGDWTQFISQEKVSIDEAATLITQT
jgi:gamma-glutamylaminecyclotransferase